MTTSVATSLQLTVRGDIPRRISGYVVHKVEQVLHAAPGGPVLHAHLVIDLSRDPAHPRPARVEVGADVNGTPVRVHVAAADVRAAGDHAADRLQQRLTHLRDRNLTRHRWLGLAAEHGWRHGAWRPTVGHPVLPPEDRQVVRRESLAPGPMSPDEAAYDMDVLDHDFLLFTDAETGGDAVVYRHADGGFGLRGQLGLDEARLTVTPLALDGPLPVLTESQAREHIEVAGEHVVFYLDALDRRGRVLYRRFDGHYGLVAPAGLRAARFS